MADVTTWVNETVGITSGVPSAFVGHIEVLGETVGLTDGHALYLTTLPEPTTMPTARTKRMRVPEGASPLIIDRVWDDYSADVVAPGEVHSIVLRIYDLDGAFERTVLHEVPVPVVGVLTAVATHASGLPDASGYNFLYRIDGALLPEGGHAYRCEFTFTILDNDGLQAFRYASIDWHISVSPRRSA